MPTSNIVVCPAPPVCRLIADGIAQFGAGNTGVTDRLLDLLTALHQRLGIDIPEADHPKLFTLNDAAAYLAARG